MLTRLSRLLPLSGVAFVLCMVGVVALEGEELAKQATAQQVVDHWAARSDTRLVLTTLAALAVLFLVAFAAQLRASLRGREHAEASASAIAFGGGLIAAGGLLLSAMVALSASRAGDAGSADAVVALDHLAQSTWVPVTAGLAVMTLAAGVGALLSGALPRGLAWPAVVLGVLLLTPAGIVGFLLTPVWVIAVSVVLFRRTARGQQVSEVLAPATV